MAMRRADDLDKLLLAELAARKERGEVTTVLDIGSGAGGQAERLATLGASVTAIDIFDYVQEFSTVSSKLETANEAGSVNFIQADIRDWISINHDAFDFVCIQRTLHYLPYLEAKRVLTDLSKITKDSLHLSVTGAASAIAKEYDVLELPIEKRFASLNFSGQETFSITAPLCIYHETEVFALLHSTGWGITWSRVSDFGNIKVVAKPV